MVRNTVQRISPTGGTLTLEWDGKSMISHVGGIRFAGGSYGRGFQVSPRGAHDFAVQFLLKEASSMSRLRLGKHELRVSSDPARTRTTIATLMGAHHELITVFGGPAPRNEQILDLFGVLDVNDEAEGMVVRPSKATGLTVYNEHVVVENGDSASIDVPGPRFVHGIVPRKSGQSTRHGEVWRSRLPGRKGHIAHDYSYVVGTGHGAAEVQFSDPRRITSDGAMDVVDSINVKWS